MKAISIRQPWAYAIIHLGKGVENRDWYCKHRGPLAIHAALKFDMEAYDWMKRMGYELPPSTLILRGGIVGKVIMRGCRRYVEGLGPWAGGPYCFLLADPVEVPFVQYRGQLGIFEVPDSALNGSTS